ncbi:MAG: hypothetical protein IT469_01625 [Pseudomonadales bacterium]|nr:hypothetical protein [Pseudomonadales bacterium]
MTDHTQHTTIIATDFEPRIIVQEDDGRWFRVLNWFYDEVVPDLNGAPLRLMLGMLRHRDNRTGLVARSRQQFGDELRLSKGGLSAAFTTLTTHPAGLLAIRGSSLFEPLPGRTFAGRILVPGSSTVEPPSPGSLQRTGVHSSEPEFTGVNRGFTGANSPSVERARARPARLVKTETQTAGPAEGERDARSGPAGWSGQTPWPQLSLFGRMAAERGDVRGVLEDLRIRPPALLQVLDIRGLSVDRILAVAGEVAADASAINKPACLAGRLLGSKLLRGVDARGRGRLNPEELSAFADMQAIRDAKSRRHHHQTTTQPEETRS